MVDNVYSQLYDNDCHVPLLVHEQRSKNHTTLDHTYMSHDHSSHLLFVPPRKMDKLL